MRRLAVLLALLCLVAAPGTAIAQGGGAFGPLPPASTPSPTPAPAPKSLDQGSVSRPLLLGIAGAVVIIFFAIGTYISRDARRNLTSHDRRALEKSEQPKTPEERRKAQQARSKARQKTRAQKQARKKQRR